MRRNGGAGESGCWLLSSLFPPPPTPVTLLHASANRLPFAAGDDKKVNFWTLTSWTLSKTVQPLSKTAWHSALYCPWGSAVQGGRPSVLVVSGANEWLWAEAGSCPPWGCCQAAAPWSG